MTYDLKKLAYRFFDEVWNQGKLEVADELLDPKYEGHLPVIGTLDRSGLKDAVRAYRSAFPDLHFELKDSLVEGDKLILHWIASGTSKNPFMGIPPSGTRASIEGFTMMLFRDGKTYRDDTQYDVLGFFKNLGVELPKGMMAKQAAQAQPETVRH